MSHNIDNDIIKMREHLYSLKEENRHSYVF